MSKLHDAMCRRMGRSAAIAERIVNGAETTDREELRKEAFAILAYMTVDLDVDLNQDVIDQMYKETR